MVAISKASVKTEATTQPKTLRDQDLAVIATTLHAAATTPAIAEALARIEAKLLAPTSASKLKKQAAQAAVAQKRTSLLATKKQIKAEAKEQAKKELAARYAEIDAQLAALRDERKAKKTS